MSIPVIAFCNNKGGVGKTTLVYHLSWMFAELRWHVLAADLDPQANLTSAFLDLSRQEQLFEDPNAATSVFNCLQPLIRGVGDIRTPEPITFSPWLHLVAGDLQLTSFEDQLSDAWPRCLSGDERSFRVTSALWRMMQQAASAKNCNLILFDLGPNLGAVNRAALIAADFIVIPVGPDLFSLQGLRNLGPRLRQWRSEWAERKPKNPAPDLALPDGRMQPVGYIVMQQPVRLDRPVYAFEQWINRFPSVYRDAVLADTNAVSGSPNEDSNRIALVKNYRSLLPLAQEARKPMFLLKPSDGALGGHSTAAKNAYQDFKQIAESIASRTGT